MGIGRWLSATHGSTASIRSGHGHSYAWGVLAVIALAILVVPAGTALAQDPVFLSGEGPLLSVPESSVTCETGYEPQLTHTGTTVSAVCVPQSRDGSIPKQSRKAIGGASGPGSISPAVSNEAGDILEVKAARPGNLYKKEGSLFTNCTLVIPYVGSSYAPCGNVYAYDAALKTSTKVPMTNSAEHVEYDACGTKISSGTSSGWHTVGTEYWSSGWATGTIGTVPSNEPTSCLGTWTITYKWTQTFSDGETLTDSLTAPFLVTQVPIPASATWGGGNPSELSCSQLCGGDPVNTATGDYFESDTDMAIVGRGPGLQLTRTYSSLAAKAGQSSALGRGWAFSYGMTLSEDPSTGYVTITNGNGSKTKFEIGANGYVAPPRVLATLVKNNSEGTYTYTVKARTIYTFDASGKLTSIADLNGKKTTFTYNASGQLQTATDSSGRSFTFSYNESGQLISVTDSTGRKVSYAYDGSGRLSEVTDIRGGNFHYTYDENGLLLTYKNPRENTVVTNTYDSSGRVLTQTDGAENKTIYSYSTSGESSTTEVTSPRGYVTKYEYFKGALVKRTEALGTESSATWTYEHDPNTLGLMAIADPNGHSSHATYDSRGNQTSTEDALGHTTKSKYDSLDDLIEHTDANGVTTTNTYDAKGNLLSTSTPLVGSNPPQSRTVTYTYGSKSFPEDVTAITDPNGKTTSFIHDAAGSLTSETDAAGDTTSYTYDSLGHVLTKVSPRGNAKGGKASEYTTTYTYDAAGNRLTESDPLGHKRTWTYDAAGNVESETDANGQKTSYGYDADNRRISVTRADGRIEHIEYDGEGNVLSQGNGLEQSTTYTYDPLDHRLSSTDPLQRTTSYVHDGVGNLTGVKDPQGRTTSFTYDAANELTETSYSDGVTPTVKYGYDADGRRTSRTDGTGESSYKYDSLGHLTSATDGHGDTTSYGYDLAGNKTGITYPNGKTVTQTFDAAERLASVTDWLGNKTTFSYDADSNLTATTLPSSTSNTDSYSYNRSDQMSGATLAKGKTTLATLSYTRGNDGQLLTETVTGLPGGNQSFSYDNLDRLTEASSQTYAYDKADNPTTFAGTSGIKYDAASELTENPSTIFSHDSLGERSNAAPTSGPSTTFKYDQAGNLVAVERTAEGEVPAISETYTYDGAGLRASQTVSGVTNYLTWDTSEGLPLLLSDGQTSYIYGSRGVPVEEISAGGVTTYYHHDQLGSTRMLTNSSGTATGSFSYAPYGLLTGMTGTQTTALGYAGQYTNAQSSMQYLRAREYDPATGQFMSRDPLAGLTGALYSYAKDSPLNGTDPSGLCNMNPLSGSFWTEGNCLSESPLNPIRYYEEEIEAIEAGCSYWDAVTHGLEGAGVLTIDAAGLLVPLDVVPSALGAADFWAEKFALQYPNLYLFLIQRASQIGAGPPVAGTVTAFFLNWMEEHLRH